MGARSADFSGTANESTQPGVAFRHTGPFSVGLTLRDKTAPQDSDQAANIGADRPGPDVEGRGI